MKSGFFTVNFIAAMTVLIIGFQNCSNSMRFEGASSQMEKFDSGLTDSLGDGSAGPADPAIVPAVEPVIDRDLASQPVVVGNPRVAPRPCDKDHDNDDDYGGDDDHNRDEHYDHNRRRSAKK